MIKLLIWIKIQLIWIINNKVYVLETEIRGLEVANPLYGWIFLLTINIVNCEFTLNFFCIWTLQKGYNNLILSEILDI